MDARYPVLVVALANRQVHTYNLQTLQQSTKPQFANETALKMQLRCVSVFPDKTGYFFF